MPPEPHEFEFAIVCALPREFDTVEALLDERYNNITTLRHYGDSNYYQTGRMGVSNVVVVCLLDMGRASAAGAAASLRSSFPHISLTLVVGICGGVPFPNTRGAELILGDVIISHQVMKFDFGRQYPDRFERRGGIKETLDRSNWAVLSLLAGLSTRAMRKQFVDLHSQYLQTLRKDTVWAYPGVDKDRLFPASREHKATGDLERPTDCDRVGCEGALITRARLNSETNPRPCIHLGPIASSDTVMKSAYHRDRLAREEHIIGFEMEGAGVCEVLSSLVIKGVCDYADSHKNKEWQDYAAASGASCAKALLECLTCTTYEECELSKEFGNTVHGSLSGQGAFYTSSRTFPRSIGIPCTMVSRSNSYMAGQSFAERAAHDPGVFSQFLNVPIRRLQGGTNPPFLEQSVLPAGLVAGETTHKELVTGNQLFQSVPYKTFFGTVYCRTEIVQRRVAIDNEIAEQRETRRTMVFYPASWLRRLGMRYGLNAMASYRLGSWKYGLRPVYAVPDNSLIFRFCETGNVEAVREMFLSGEASIYGTNSWGWSLLHIAALKGHSRLAKFLIAHGADKRAFAYEMVFVAHHTPETFIGNSTFRHEHVAVMYLFADCLEFSQPTSNGWILLTHENDIHEDREPFAPVAHEYYSLLLRKYREDLTRTFDDHGLLYALRLASERDDIVSIKFLLDFVPDQQRYTEITSGYAFGEPFESILSDCFLVHEALIDRGADLRAFNGETPTARSLRSSLLFFRWSSTVRAWYPDINRLVSDELTERHPPSLNGWNRETLLDLWSIQPIQRPPNRRLDQGDFIYPDEVECCNCGLEARMLDIQNKGYMLEPWWEEVKHQHMQDTLNEDEYDAYQTQNSEAAPSRQSAESRVGLCTDARDKRGNGEQPAAPHAAESVIADTKSQPDADFSDSSIDETDSNLLYLPFELVLQDYYNLYGPWSGYYRSGEIFCLRCFANLESWDSLLFPDDTRSQLTDNVEDGDSSQRSTDCAQDENHESDPVNEYFAYSEPEEETGAAEEEEYIDPLGID
ncbi:hypothetical protein COH20_004757 [Aspergillus flavus]|nr:hypothetical protein COH20_004757 [Aspergillus flavus]RAQ81525.1 hypothetical protein COH21_009723 [Aspergillus flavus]